MHFGKDPESGIEIFTHKIYTQEIFSTRIFIGLLAIHLTCLSIESFIAGSQWSHSQEWDQEGEEAATISRKKMKLWELILSTKVIKDKVKSKTYKLNQKDLLVLVR